MHFLLDVFQTTAIALMTQLNSSSEVVNHSDALFFRYGTNLLIVGHFEFSNGMWIVLKPIFLLETSRYNKFVGFRSGEFGDHSGPQPIWELMVESLHRDVDSMWSCLIFLEPLHILIHTKTSSKSMCKQNLVLNYPQGLICYKIPTNQPSEFLICLFK